MSRKKPWERTVSLSRRVNTREVKQTFLIVCEGEKTEPNYFKSFRVLTATVRVEGAGMNTLSLIRETIRLKEGGDYDQVWCVFDKDDFSPQDFNAAIELAKQNGIRAAYSNQSFELWYLLHFQYCDAAIRRAQYIRRLRNHLNRSYRKNDPEMYSLLQEKQTQAIRNAKKLLTSRAANSPAVNDPSTTVHQLVLELNKYLD